MIAVLIAAGLIGAALLVLRRARSGQVRPEQHDEEESKEVTLELTYPAGGSPYVFQYGWIFGARAIVAPGTPDETDISDTVQWYGDATFDPPVGQTSRPSFEHRGGDMVGQRATKTITLKVEVDGISTETTTKVNVTGTAGYAGVGDLSKSPADAHGCPACPHPAVGPITAGSATVMIPGFGGGDLVPAARVGDSGVHAACCGPNKMMAILDGDSSVLIDGKHAARMGSTTQHCGGLGKIITGSSGGGP